MTESLVDAAKKLTAKEVGLAVVWFLGTVAPGFLIVFYFLPKIAESYDFLKLLLLSISLSLPLNVVNLAISAALSPDLKNSNITSHWFDGSAAASISTYIALYIAYYFAISFPNFVLILLAINIPIACLTGYLGRSSKSDDAP